MDMKKFMGLTHFIKSVLQERVTHSLYIFFGPCHGVSSVGHIRPVIVFDTMKKFIGLTHLIKPILQERVAHYL